MSEARHNIYKDGFSLARFRSRTEETAALAAREAALAEDSARRAVARQAEMCEHMLAVIEACRANSVHFSAVEGDFIVCKNCKLEIFEASDVFPDINQGTL